MLSQTLTVALVLGVALLGPATSAAEGVVQKASKDATKGAINAVQQELNQGALANGAKQAAKAMVDGVADAVPTVTSQIVNQANVNKKAIGKVARQVSAEAVAGAFGTTVREVDESLGKRGDGPLADTLAATAERLTAATMRGVVSELRPDPATTEKLTAAAVRGAVSELRFNIPIWPIALAFVLGGVSTLLCGVGLMLLYLLLQHRRAPENEKVVRVRSQPVSVMG